MVTKLTSGLRPGEFILSEATHNRSRDNLLTAPSATKILRGTVCGKLTATGKVMPLAPAAADGSDDAACINIYDGAPNTVDRLDAYITRDAEVIGDGLIWPAGISAGDKAIAVQQLAAVGIIVRPPSYVG